MRLSSASFAAALAEAEAIAANVEASIARRQQKQHDAAASAAAAAAAAHDGAAATDRYVRQHCMYKHVVSAAAECATQSCTATIAHTHLLGTVRSPSTLVAFSIAAAPHAHPQVHPR
jgi:ElaB/YqjD/DUF883 family membrane-anchored ribosome-binding protein